MVARGLIWANRSLWNSEGIRRPLGICMPTRLHLRGGIMSKEAVKTPIDDDRYSRAPPITFGVIATWLLAMAFGVAFWTVLFHVVSAIVGQFY
jgi:hypothetical protein